jgi:hypothetical protein
MSAQKEKAPAAQGPNESTDSGNKYINHLKGYQISLEIAMACPQATFCTFQVTEDRDGKVKKIPLRRSGGQGVGGNTPAEELYSAQDILDGTHKAPASAGYMGVCLHEPIFTDDGSRMLTILDIDGKNRGSSDLHDDLKVLYVDMGTLGEVSHSKKGFHQFYLALPDSSLVPTFSVAPGQEIEVFGQTTSDKKSIMLTGIAQKDFGIREVDSLRDEVLTKTGFDLHLEGLPVPVLVGMRAVNDAALKNLSKWVPTIFPKAVAGKTGYRVSSRALGRNLEEDISFEPEGIVDFGKHDMGDARQGKRTAIDILIEHQGLTPSDAAIRLCLLMGYKFEFESTKAGFVRDPNAVLEGERIIRSATSYEELFNGAPHEALVSLKGLDETDLEHLAQYFKDRAKLLGSKIPVSAAREKVYTLELQQLESLKKQDKVKRQVDGREAMAIYGGDIHLLAKRCAKLLKGTCYFRAQQVVSLGYAPSTDETPAYNHRSVVPVTPQWMVRELTERVAFTQKLMGGEELPVNCPQGLASIMVSGAPSDFYNDLVAIARAPFLREDGSLCITDGYDEKTGIYLESDVTVNVPENPTREDATAAVDKLLSLVKDFPFASELDKSAWLADLLGAVVRINLPVAPLTLYTATRPGTGKSLLLGITNTIAYGSSAFAGWPKTGAEDELRKTFTSTLMSGAPALCWDNLPNDERVDSAVLAGAITTPVWLERMLGGNTMMQLKNRMRLVVTGNRISTTKDLIRRTLTVSLDVNRESVHGRDFEIGDIQAHVIAKRGEYLSAVLTILRAYHLSGGVPVAPLASFEDWSEKVIAPIVWLGMPNPITAVQDSSNDEGRAEAFIFERLAAIVKSSGSMDVGKWTARELAPGIGFDNELCDAFENEGYPEPPTNPKMLGRWLSRHQMKVAGGFKLIATPSRTGALTYTFKEVPQ